MSRISYMDFSTSVQGSAGTTFTVDPGATPVGARIGFLMMIINSGTLVTSVAGKGATWTRIASKLGTGIGVELWWGINPTTTGNITVTQVSARNSLVMARVQWAGDSTTPPTPTVVSATGSSTTVDPGLMTVASTDEVIVSCLAWVGTGTSTSAFTPSDATGIKFTPAATLNRGDLFIREPDDLTSYKVVDTIATAQWAAMAVKWTPDQDTLAAKVYKGRQTLVLDDAEVA